MSKNVLSIVDVEQELTEGNEKTFTLKAVRDDSVLAGVSSVSDIIIALQKSGEEFDLVCIEDKNFAKFKDGKYQILEESAEYFNRKYGVEVEVIDFRMEKTNVEDDFYKVMVSKKDEVERPLLNKDLSEFSTNSSADALSEIIKQGKKIERNIFATTSKPETVRILKLNDIPLLVVQGDRIIHSDIVADEVTKSFSSNPKNTVNILMPQYDAVLNADQVNKALIKKIVDKINSPEELDSVVGKLREKYSNKVKQSTLTRLRANRP